MQDKIQLESERIANHATEETGGNLPCGTRRAELHRQLKECLENLEPFVARPYRKNSSLDRWPSVKHLNRMSKLVQQLGDELGIRKLQLDFLCSVMRRLDRHYPKLGLLAFMEALVTKIEAVPLGPVTRIDQAIKTCPIPVKREQLIHIRDLLRSSDWDMCAKPAVWRELSQTLSEVSGDWVDKLVMGCKPSSVQQIDFHAPRALFKDIFALTTFLELKRQHLLWRVLWDREMLPIATWIYALMDDEWDNRLRRVLIVAGPTPAQFAKATETYNERLKKRRHRKRHRSV